VAQEDPSHLGIEVLGDVEVAGELSRELQLPDPREVADHVAGGGKSMPSRTSRLPFSASSIVLRGMWQM
jgi:hypothetical protein